MRAMHGPVKDRLASAFSGCGGGVMSGFARRASALRCFEFGAVRVRAIGITA